MDSRQFALFVIANAKLAMVHLLTASPVPQLSSAHYMIILAYVMMATKTQEQLTAKHAIKVVVLVMTNPRTVCPVLLTASGLFWAIHAYVSQVTSMIVTPSVHLAAILARHAL
jgi:hypothetical protein